jgi:hypothetical protein
MFFVGLQFVQQAVNVFFEVFLCVCIQSCIFETYEVWIKLWYINFGDVDPENDSFVLAYEEQGVLTRPNQLMHGAMKLHQGSGFSATIVSAQTSPHYSDISSL